MKKIQRMNKERLNRGLERGKEKKKPQVTLVIKITKKQEAETLQDRLGHWVAQTDYKHELILLLFCLSITVYTSVGVLAGYQAQTAIIIIFSSVIVTVLGELGRKFYGKMIRLNPIFGSRYSWFRNINCFLWYDFRNFSHLTRTKSLQVRLFSKTLILVFCLPLYTAALSMIYTALLAVLILDWLRIAFICLINFWFSITPVHFVGVSFFGAGLGGLFGILVFKVTFVNLFLSAVGGITVWLCLSAYKEWRNAKYGTYRFSA